MKTLLRLFVMELRAKSRDKKVLLLLIGLIFFYGTYVGVNLTNYQEITGRLKVDETDGIFLRVPLSQPIKTYSFFDNFIPYEAKTVSYEDSQVGFFLLADKWEDPNTITWSTRILLLFSTLAMVLLGYNEITSLRERGLFLTLITGTAKKTSILQAKFLTGAVLSLVIFLGDTFFALTLLALRGVELEGLQYAQIIWFNFFYCFLLLIIYNLTLALSAVESANDSGLVLIKAVVALLVMIFVIPTIFDSLRNFVLHMAGREYRLGWYWYTRYFYLGDIFSSFGELTTDMLYLNRAQLFYASLPWTKGVAAFGSFTLGKVFLINWFKFITFGFWAVISYLFAARRWTKSDVL